MARDTLLKISVLIVEDSVDDAELLVLELERGDFELEWDRVDEANELKKALQARNWDIVISDYSMSGFSGVEALKIVRQHDAILPFILVSGAVGEAVAVEMMREGAQDYVLKQNLVRLLTAVRREIKDAKIKRKALEDANNLKAAYEEVARLKTQLEQENRYLQEEIKLEHNFNNIVFGSQEFTNLLVEVEQVAPVDATVLILGETGTGKELIARAVHNLSQRKDKSLVKVNCAALPRELIESELFGHEKGAFTGAYQQKIGRFELAQNGTIFLDEIGELPPDLQAKLLRVLQEGELERIGGNQTIQLNIRVIAATNRDLQQAMAAGTFREDLYYRLHVFPLHIPPLRERKDDIPHLLNFFLNKLGRKFNKTFDQVPRQTLEMLQAYDWPGNVRELENLVERALILSRSGELPFAQLLGVTEPEGPESTASVTALREIERRHILKILKSCDWKINGTDGAAAKLALTPTTVRDRMKKHGIVRPGKK